MTARTLAVKCAQTLLGEKTYRKSFRPCAVSIWNTLRSFPGGVRRFFLQLLLVSSIRSLVLRMRYLFNAKILRRLRVYKNPDEAVSENTVHHNLNAFKFPLVLPRTCLLIRPFSVIETLGPDSHILVIGPRSEDDIFHLRGYGFQRITGLDLLSYSPYIDLGDMHCLPYQDNTFDAVILGWVIPYSNTPDRVAKEVVRVAKHGAIIAIGGEHHPDFVDMEQLKQRSAALVGYRLGGRHLNTTAEYLQLFSGAVKRVFFDHEVGSEQTDRTSNTCVIFSITKQMIVVPSNGKHA
jgi:SAM-dependent methyltransferase